MTQRREERGYTAKFELQELPNAVIVAALQSPAEDPFSEREKKGSTLRTSRETLDPGWMPSILLVDTNSWADLFSRYTTLMVQ